MPPVPLRSSPAAHRTPQSPLAASLAICVSLGAGACSEPEPRLPNVLFVVTDTLRADHLSWNGYERETTPFLTTLAERGVVFERTFSSSTWTAPAMASVFTGVLPSQHGVLTGYAVYGATGKAVTPIELNRIPQELETLPEMMEALGYRTFGVADNANIHELSGFTHGFDRFSVLWIHHHPITRQNMG